VNAIIRALDNDFRPGGSHHRKQTICIDDTQWRNFIVDPHCRGGESAAERRMNLYNIGEHNQQRERSCGKRNDLSRLDIPNVVLHKPR